MLDNLVLTELHKSLKSLRSNVLAVAVFLVLIYGFMTYVALVLNRKIEDHIKQTTSGRIVCSKPSPESLPVCVFEKE